MTPNPPKVVHLVAQIGKLGCCSGKKPNEIKGKGDVPEDPVQLLQQNLD